MIGRALNMERMPTMASAMPVPPISRPVLTTSRHPVVLRSSIRLWATTSNDMSGSLPRQSFAEQSLRAEDQDHHEKREGDEVAQLIGRRNAEPIEKERRSHRFDDAEKEATEHRPGNIAYAAEHSGAEGLDAGKKAHVEIDLLVDEAIEHAADAGHRGAKHKGEDDHPVRICAREASP